VAKKTLEAAQALRLHKAKKGTSIGNGEIKLASMNKHQKRNYKPYRGQGR
jgi:hypothetical protein